VSECQEKNRRKEKFLLVMIMFKEKVQYQQTIFEMNDLKQKTKPWNMNRSRVSTVFYFFNKTDYFCSIAA